MIKKIYPTTAPQVLYFLRNVNNKSLLFPNKDTMPLPREYYDEMIVYLPIIEREMREASDALVAQMMESSAKWLEFHHAEMYISHFIQVFNLGIQRGIYPAEHRQYYKIDVNSSKLPEIGTETELQTWFRNIKDGDASRVAAGGKPMTNPTAAEVETVYQSYFDKAQAQSGLKDAYKAELKDVNNILAEGVLLSRDICDELEHKYRKETDSRRRELCREWGMVYKVISAPSGEEPIQPLTGKVAALAVVIIKEGGFDANSSFTITNIGTVILHFYTAAVAGEPGSGAVLELAPGMQKEVFASELGAEGNTFLMVYNPSETSEGIWEVVEGE